MEKIIVMLAGLPGKMATLVAEAIVCQEDMELYSCALGKEGCIYNLTPVRDVQLFPAHMHERVMRSANPPINMIVDFTLPNLVNRNTELYCSMGVPFIMGTTGGNRQKLVETIKASEISAVVDTNMAMPVVIFQAMVRFVAENFKHSLEGFKLVIRESHQAQKLDLSGTAVSMLESFKALGIPFIKEQIIMVRDPVVQEVEMRIPVAYLSGHGYHTYTLLSPDGTVMLQFTHNILGRNAYIDGVLRAIRFLSTHKGEKGKVFSMVDVLRG